MIYLIILIALLVFAYIYDYREVTSMRTMWLVIMFVVMVLVAGLRYRLGQDTVTYMGYYDDSPTLWQLGSYRMRATRFAPLFLFFQAFPRSLSNDFVLMQIWHAFWVNLVIFWFLKKNTRHVFFGLLMYFIFLYPLFMMQVMRESLAVVMFLLAWPSYKKNNWLLYYALVTIAFFFHVSAIVLFLIPIIKIKGIRQLFVFGKRTIVVSVVVLGIGYLIQSMFFEYIQLLAISENVTERAATYSRDIIGGQLLSFSGAINRLVQWVLLPVLAMYFINKKRVDYNDAQRKELVMLEQLVLVLLYITLLSIPIEILGRYLNYFFLFGVIMVSDWFFESFKFNKRKIKLSFLAWMLVLIPSLVVRGRDMMAPVSKNGRYKTYMVYYPYNSYFDMQENQDREAAIRYIRGY